MIHFELVCAAGHRFEAWFRSSESFEGQRQSGALSCPVCANGEIRKAPMAPNVVRRGRHDGSNAASAEAPQAPAAGPTLAELEPLLTKLRRHIEETCEDVGARFPEEARRIHYGECEARPIFGEATWPDAVALREEGIMVEPLPWLIRRND
jgi:hypothetical protein